MFATRTRGARRLGGSDGFTLLETLTVAALIGVVMAMAIPVSSSFIRLAKADSATLQAMAALDLARDRAVAERRNIEVIFLAPNRIRLSRQEIDAAGNVVGTTVVEEFLLENGQRFVKFAGVPDTPDAFGASTAVSFTGTTPVMFTSDGSLVDASGDVTNGTILMGTPGRVDTARAVTVFGTTGLTRTWKWRATKWME